MALAKAGMGGCSFLREQPGQSGKQGVLDCEAM